MSKKKYCIRCGEPLPLEASFCPRCTASQMARQSVEPPRAGGRRRRTAWLCGAAALVLAAALTGGLLLRPDEPVPEEDTQPSGLTGTLQEDTCQTYYEGADGRLYHVFACFSPQPDGGAFPASHREELLPADEPGTSPLCLFVEDAEDRAADVRDAFRELLRGHTVEAVAAEGSDACVIHEETDSYGDAGALLAHEHQVTSACTYNDIIWTLYMKNGDEIQLTMTVEFEEQTTLYFGQQDAPLDTAQELQALLDRLAQEYDADTAITVELPGVTYDRPITVGCAVTLRGTGTVFAAPVTVSPLADTKRAIACVHFQETAFTGGGVGTGITAGAPTYLENCRVTGWEVGTLAVSGGWVYLYEGYVGGNDVGARYDSAYSSSYTYTIRRIDFMSNGTALELLCMPPRAYAVLEDCRFRGNDVDVANPGSYRIEVGDGTEVTL